VARHRGTAVQIQSAPQAGRAAPARVTDLVIVMGERAANTLSHLAAGRTVRIWPSGGEIIGQVEDTG
jgi:hypothetical protein